MGKWAFCFVDLCFVSHAKPHARPRASKVEGKVVLFCLCNTGKIEERGGKHAMKRENRAELRGRVATRVETRVEARVYFSLGK